MLAILVRSSPKPRLEYVTIARSGTKFRKVFSGRAEAIAWLTNQGCCPGAAAMLHEVELDQLCEIAEPLDLPGSHAPE